MAVKKKKTSKKQKAKKPARKVFKKTTKPKRKAKALKAPKKKTAKKKAAPVKGKVMKTLGYNNDLLILAFDHRGSFQSKLFGIKGKANPEENKLVSSYKSIIYDGFKRAVQSGAPKAAAGILVDEEFGLDIIDDAKKQGFTVANPTEKSGQEEFDFEFGADYKKHIERFKPDFVKVLVRYNSNGDSEMNERQTKRLADLSDYCMKNNHRFIFELLVPETQSQLAEVGGSKERFDSELRPKLMVQAMRDLQNGGVEPDVWKVEGVETTEDAAAVAAQARTGGRSKVGVVILGRGENNEKVKMWLRTAAQVPGFIGFAVGRTIFWDPLMGVKEGRLTRDQAVDQVAKNYRGFVEIWKEARESAQN